MRNIQHTANTAKLYAMYDTDSTYIGVANETGTLFFPFIGMSSKDRLPRFPKETVMEIGVSYTQTWEETQPFLEIVAEYERNKLEDPESVTNETLWNKVCERFTPNRVRFNGSEEEGTLLNIHDGEVHILWDAHKGSKLPLFSYPIDSPEILAINPIPHRKEESA